MTRTLLSPEAQLLLLTAAVPPSETGMRRLLTAGIDWAKLCALAEHEKATSIALRQLWRLGLAVPHAAAHELRQLAAASVMQMLHLEQLLHKTLDVLAEQGIDVMLLKGAGLGYTAYPSFVDRPMVDLDVLVPPHRAAQAWSLLQTHGWTWPSARWASQRYTAHQHLPPLIQDPGGASRLEIHGDLLPGGHPFRFSAATVWAQAKQVPLNGRVLTVPHPLHQLWHVCVHFAWSHEMQWGAWRTLRDVAAIIWRGDVEWPEFVDLARKSQAGTCCFWTLRLSRRLAGADVPDRVLAALRPPRPELLLERIERHYVSNLFPSRDGCPSVLLARRLWEAGILPRWSGHGPVRPWHVCERWMAGSEIAGSEQHESEQPRHRPLWAQLRKLGAGLAYLRRTQRFALPVNAP